MKVTAIKQERLQPVESVSDVVNVLIRDGKSVLKRVGEVSWGDWKQFFVFCWEVCWEVLVLVCLGALKFIYIALWFGIGIICLALFNKQDNLLFPSIISYYAVLIFIECARRKITPKIILHWFNTAPVRFCRWMVEDGFGLISSTISLCIMLVVAGVVIAFCGWWSVIVLPILLLIFSAMTN